MLNAEQLHARQQGIGGSEAAAVCGVDKYRQPLDVWAEKVLGIRDETIGDKEVVRWGNLLEETIGKEWADRHGVEVRRDNRTRSHKDLPWMLGSIDFRITGKQEGLEIKARGHFAASDYGPNGTDQVTEPDILQCQQYMAVYDWKLWHMAVLIGGQELRTYTIPRDQTLIDNMICIEGDFWDSVENKIKPPMDYAHQAAPQLLSRLYPGTNGETIVLPARALAATQEMDLLKATRKDADKEIRALKSEIADMMGESAVGLLPGGGGWRRKEITKKEYMVKESTYIDTRFSRKLGV